MLSCVFPVLSLTVDMHVDIVVIIMIKRVNLTITSILVSKLCHNIMNDNLPYWGYDYYIQCII